MRIRRLTMHNFGAYASTNTLELNENKPIVLIGGLNGRGKTTILEAVLLALYGTNSFAYKESKFRSYGQYLRSYVNRADGTLRTFVELEFIINNTEQDRYMIHREWDALNEKRTSEKILVEKNGRANEFLTKNWPMFIENILPSALSNFFFFDGEKIADLAVDNTGKQLKESIRAMLGITVLDTLRGDLNRNIRRISKNQGDDSAVSRVNALRDAKQSAEEKLSLMDDQISQLQEELHSVNEQLEQKRAEYSSKGGDVVDRREELLTKKTRIEEKKNQNNEKMMALASGELPFSLVRDLIEEIANQGEAEQRASVTKQATAQINTLFKEYLDQANDTAAARHFVDFVNEQARESDVNEIYHLSDQVLYQAKRLSEVKAEENIEDAKNVLESQRKLTKQENELDNYLAIDINEEDLKQIYRDIRKLEIAHEDLEVRLHSKNQERSHINGEVMKATAAFNREVTKALSHMEASDDADRDLKYTEMAIRILDEYSIRLQQRKTDLLGKTITECYKRLANKKNLIDKIIVDPVTLDMKYLDHEDHEVKKTALSAGEKQLMVISVLWALAICSKKKLPVIIDTPLSRLDSNHRKALIQIYFPQASDQTIILSTDTEIDRNYYELMKDNVGDEFTLKYSDETKSTTIHRGYFPGEVS